MIKDVYLKGAASNSTGVDILQKKKHEVVSQRCCCYVGWRIVQCIDGVLW